MALLSSDEVALAERLHTALTDTATSDQRLLRYYRGLQSVEHLGMAVPPQMRRFLVLANWPRVFVEGVEARQDVRQIILPDQVRADAQMRELYDANNLDSDLTLFKLDHLVYGRAFMSVGANEDDPDHPLLHVESPLEMAALVDKRRRRMIAAARFYDYSDSGDATALALYQPDSTTWAEQDGSGRWSVVDRDDHRLGRVPVTMSLCRRMSGSYLGESAMTDIMGLTDAAARSLTNLQFAQEAHGVPQRYALGVAQGDFVDADGNPIPRWEAYFNAVWSNANPNVRVGQFDASDLKNFETAVTLYARLASSVTGFPAEYFGLHTANPPAEGAIRANETRMVKFVERQNAQVGTVLGWTLALGHRFRTGEWLDGDRVRVQWHDPATPTFSQRADALMKLTGGKPILSREGAWDELGFDDARKAQERNYMEQEADDPTMERLFREIRSAEPSDAAIQ